MCHPLWLDDVTIDTPMRIENKSSDKNDISWHFFFFLLLHYRWRTSCNERTYLTGWYNEWPIQNRTIHWILDFRCVCFSFVCVECIFFFLYSLRLHSIKKLPHRPVKLSLLSFNKCKSKSCRRMHALHSMDWNVIWRWIQWEKYERKGLGIFLFFFLSLWIAWTFPSFTYVLLAPYNVTSRADSATEHWLNFLEERERREYTPIDCSVAWNLRYKKRCTFFRFCLLVSPKGHSGWH